MKNTYDITPHDWLGKNCDRWQRWVERIATDYPVFAETVNSIKNPLYEKDVFKYFEEDTYKGIIAATLWLDNHRRKWASFKTFPSARADRIRYCVDYLAKLLEDLQIYAAFYSLFGWPYNMKKIPTGVETCYIAATRPWEMLHFIGYKLPPEERLPVFNEKMHFSMLKEVDPRLAFRWYSEWKDGRLEADMNNIDTIYFDYCQRIQNQH